MIFNYMTFRVSRFLLLLLLLAGMFWDMSAWCEKTHFFEQTGVRINEIDISPDRSMLVTGGFSKTVIVWNFSNLQPIFNVSVGQTVTTVKFSKDQRYIAAGNSNNNQIKVIQISATHTFTTSTFNSNLGSVQELDFSWDNTRLLICGQTGFEVRAVGPGWTRENGTTFSTTTAAMSCKFQKNNQYFIGETNGKCSIYNTVSNTLLWSDTPAGSQAISADFDMVNQTLVVAGAGSNKAYLYPSAQRGTGTSQILNKTLNIGASANNIAFAKEGSIFAVGANNFLLIYDNLTSNMLFNWTGTNTSTAGVFSYDSQFYVSGNVNGLIKVYKRSCQSCHSGTYEFKLTCAPCSAAIPGCLTCANSSFCFSCGDGYGLDTTTKLCVLCHNSLPGCVLCNTTAICTACSSLSYLQSNACISCQNITNCLTCSDSSTCTRCNSDFYASGGSCVPCAVNNCLSCYNNSACINCVLGYYLEPSNLTCSRCPLSKCTDCNSSITCTQCMERYYLTNTSTCASCPTNCLACTSSACLRCIVSSYSSGNACLSCPSSCASCTGAFSCSTCVPAFFFNGSTCNQCSGNCLTCTSATLCLSCSINYYYLSASNSCSKCQNLKANCLQCTNTTCLTCESGYYYDGTNCVKCALTSFCQSCTNSTFCLSCLSGYQLSSATGVCSRCTTGCSSCANSTLCITCLPKYYFSSGSCLLCPNVCPTCKNNTSCLSCIQNYYLNGSSCLTCNTSISNCLTCTSNAYCTSCELGYRLDSTNTSCTRCTWPCSICNISQCADCATGYYLLGLTCSVCSVSCSSCSVNSTVCTSCVNGFFLTASNTCTSCQTLSVGCTSCNQSVCFSCQANMGFYLVSGSCTLCSSITNCLQCSNSTYCTSCSYGYYASSGSCIPCSNVTSNCQSCTATACLNCIDPYFLSGSTCQLCSEGCAACFNGTSCKNCLTGYFLQSAVCTFCDTLLNGCQVCTSTSVCIECAEGYILSSNSCVSCRSQIEGCQFCNSTTVCATCMDQYYLLGNSCAKCSVIPGCSQCNSSSLCLTCQTGYFQTNNNCSRCADSMCVTCLNSTQCIACLTGYLVSGGSCVQCNSSFSGCVLCNTTSCLQCQSGFYVSSSNQCSSCQVSGCQICNVFAPTQCVTCSSLYYLSASRTCSSCSLSMVGCISCTTATNCVKCMVGSYLTASFTCQSCYYLFSGCAQCSATACSACQGGYIMNGTVCRTCISLIDGCLYCTSASVCLSCQSGYYQAGNTCVPCSGITGCLDCSGPSTCNLCSDTYYLNSADNLCYICNTTLAGCISCASQTTCKACLGNYALSSGSCTALKTTSSQPYQELRLVTEFMSKQQLLHRLIVRGTFNTQTAVNLTDCSNITMLGGNGTSLKLNIYSYRWISQYELNFITNNPIGANFNTLFKKMPVARLMAQSSRHLQTNIDLNYQFKLDMTESAIQSILPESTHSGSLSLSSPADNPSFIRSVYTQLPYNYHYFGLVVTLLVLTIYFVKCTVSVPQSDDQGEIISHIFLLRCGGVIFSLVYMEYMDYCYGFLTSDLPWLNLLTAPLAASADLSPNSYLLFYSNMTLASSYLSSLCLVIAILLSLGLAGGLKGERWEGLKGLGVFLYNFLEVGLIMAGSMSIQGAYYNNLNYLTANSWFYLVGIVLFVVVAVVSVWMALVSIHRINKVRVLVKTSFLSLLYVSPIYLLPIALAVELIFVVAEYNIKKTVKLHPHLWLTNQIIVNLALLALVLLSDSYLAIYLPSTLVGIALAIDLFIHIRQYRHQEQLVKVKQIQKLTILMETQQKLNRTIKKRNNTIYEKSKINDTVLTSNAFNQDLIFSTLDEDMASSKSPFSNTPKKKENNYIFDDFSESIKQL